MYNLHNQIKELFYLRICVYIVIITSTELDMDILGIDTENETKGISVSNPLNGNNDDIKSPKLSVVDSIGVELLANREDEKKKMDI